MSEQRRREERIRPGGVSLWLRIEDRATICPVLNISRLGIAIELPNDEAFENLPSFSMGSVLKATLKIAGKTLPLGLRVLRLRGSQLGCSFEFPDDSTQSALAQSLSPHFVASSLDRVSPQVLRADVKEAFFGSDFSMVFFKKPGCYRICTGGYEFQVDPERVDVVRPDAWSGDSDAEDFLVASAYDFLPKDDASYQAVVDRIIRTLESWSEKAHELQELIGRLRGLNA